MMHTNNNLVTILPMVFVMSLYIPSVLAGDAAAGKAVYDGGGCAACHGATGAGDGVAAAAMNPKPASFTTGAFRLDTDGDGKAGADADLSNVIKNGAAKYGGNAGMPPRTGISSAELANLVAYIRSLKK